MSRSPHSGDGGNESHRVFTTKLLGRLALGWTGVLTAFLLKDFLRSPLPLGLSVAILAVLVAVILVCSAGVVVEAERLAAVLGDPYGTLILSVSIAIIEVILIAAVMLGPGSSQTIARDSIMAVSMIILNLVVGSALLIEARRTPAAVANRRGALIYLALIAALLAFAFASPAVLASSPRAEFLPSQQVWVAIFSGATYCVFLYLQTGPWRGAFQEVPSNEGPLADGRTSVKGPSGVSTTLPRHARIAPVIRERGRELLARTAAIAALMVPVVVLSNDMAHQLERVVVAANAPVALSGLVIAMIVFLPETITTLRASAFGEAQRVSNLTHGALLSTLGITIPVVLTLGLVAGVPVVMGESALNLGFLAVTLAVSVATFASEKPRLRPAQGKLRKSAFAAAHLTLFAFYLGHLFAG